MLTEQEKLAIQRAAGKVSPGDKVRPEDEEWVGLLVTVLGVLHEGGVDVAWRRAVIDAFDRETALQRAKARARGEVEGWAELRRSLVLGLHGQAP